MLVCQISQMLAVLSSHSIRDVLTSYLLSLPSSTSLRLVTSWTSHWRKLITRTRSRQSRHCKLRSLFISEWEFCHEDRESMFLLLSRSSSYIWIS